MTGDRRTDNELKARLLGIDERHDRRVDLRRIPGDVGFVVDGEDLVWNASWV